MARMLPVLMAIPVVVSFGLAEGVWMHRWKPLPDLELAAARLAQVPMPVGEWEGQALELDARQVAIGEIAGYIRRQYVHRRTGKSLTLMLLCGRAGPITVHPPEICFGGAGFSEVTPPEKFPVKGAAITKPSEFWTAKFQKRGALEPEQIRIFWSWGAAGEWTAADYPRLKFASYPILYKLYVIRPLGSLSEPLEEDPSAEFLQLFLPEVANYLSPVGAP